MNGMDTVLLAIIALCSIVSTILLFQLSKKLVEAAKSVHEKLNPAIENITESSQNLVPVIETIKGKNEEIERILHDLPDMIENFKVISEQIRPITEEISDRTPEIRESLQSLTDTSEKIQKQANELSDMVGPSIHNVSSIFQAVGEGIRIFQSYKSKKPR